jgi:Ni/Fe-hydrogenase subunit HybB-like protein
VLFVPIALAARKIYVWIDPPAGLGEEVLRNIEHKHGYLNLPGFLWRAAIYFAIWLLISELLYRHSVAQDEDGAPHWTASNRRWGSVGLPLVALAATFAAFDWVMSLNPTWFSTLFGVYFLTGSFVAGLSLLILILAFVHEPGSFSELVKKPHFHNLGKLLFAFVCFWGYIAFSQYMLMFHANLPEEVPWFLVRTRGAWRPFALLLAFGRFIVPFFVLLSRDLKMRPKALSVVAGWLLFMHLIDLIWLVFPSAQMHDFGTRWAPANLGLHWTLITAFVGVGGVWAASALWRMRGKYLVPIGDPYLEDSLRYVQP